MKLLNSEVKLLNSEVKVLNSEFRVKLLYSEVKLLKLRKLNGEIIENEEIGMKACHILQSEAYM